MIVKHRIKDITIFTHYQVEKLSFLHVRIFVVSWLIINRQRNIFDLIVFGPNSPQNGTFCLGGGALYKLNN